MYTLKSRKFKPEPAGGVAAVALENSVAALRKSYNNTHTVVAYLPDEIWAKIFHDTVCLLPNYDSHRFAYTQVCNRWREIAFTDPVLWKDISSDHPTWMLKSLILSQSLQLHVDIGTNYGTSPVMDNIVFTILKELNRIESLSIAVPNVESMYKFTNCMPDHGTAPVMTQLRLSILNGLHAAILPPDLFCGGFRAMRTLRLDNCSLSWDSCISRNLTTMEVTLPTSSPDAVVDPKAHVKSILKLLSDTPALECLTLVNCLISIYREDWWDENFPSRGDPNWPKVHLSSLTHLTVDEEILSTCSLLAQLCLPNASSVRLTCTCDRENAPYSILSLYGAVKAALPVHFGKTMERLKLDGIGTSSLRVTGYCPDHDCFKASPTFTLRLSWAPWSHNRVSEFLTGLSDSGFLASIRFLHISMLQSLSREEWVSLLQALPAVESIYLRGDSLMGLQDALLVADRNENSIVGADTNAPLLPELRFLHADRCKLHSAAGFARFLRQRRDTKHGLHRLQITCCEGFSRSSVKCIGTLVDELEWDELQGWQDESDEESLDLDGREFYADDFYSSE